MLHPLHEKVAAISVFVGIALVGFIVFLRKNAGRKPKPAAQANSSASKQGIRCSSTNGEGVPSKTNSNSTLCQHSCRRSVDSDQQTIRLISPLSVQSEASTPSITVTPQQLGNMGVEALRTAIGYWESALASFSSPPDDLFVRTASDEGEFPHMMGRILSEAYNLQEQYSRLFLNENSDFFKENTSSSSQERSSTSDRRTVSTLSSVDSTNFPTQVEVTDFQDTDEVIATTVDLKELTLYQLALKKYEEESVPIRCSRTEMVKCQTNMEFASKVYCIRIAFKTLFENNNIHEWFFEVGYKILAELMLTGQKDPEPCLKAYENIVNFFKSEAHWALIKEELQDRGVKDFTFYDIAIDFIVIDIFKDLENPPSHVKAVLQNQSLSTSFKEIAITTAIELVLNNKRKTLEFSDGFMSRFYSVSEHLIPALAWGFLGPDGKLKDFCTFLKNEIFGFVQDIFNFDEVRFSNIEDLTSDIMKLAKQRFQSICEQFTF